MGLESFGGANIFGMAVHFQHVPRPNAHQVNSFFGADGNVVLSGGTRGRTFEVSGALVGENLAALLAAESALLSFADGVARTLIDPIGRSFANVCFHGEYLPSPEGPINTGAGVCLPYRAVLHGLT